MSQTDDDLRAVPVVIPDGPEPVAVPCTILLAGGARFVVSDVGAWAYHEHGVFATGRWANSDEEIDLLIPYAQIQWTQLHYDQLIEFNAAEQAAA